MILLSRQLSGGWSMVRRGHGDNSSGHWSGWRRHHWQMIFYTVLSPHQVSGVPLQLAVEYSLHDDVYTYTLNIHVSRIRYDKEIIKCYIQN